jgi:FkbM family methyltransferase|tara:strand:+ start:2954 stop:3739 length:786 start_codon:yes stop_codon:yes gene_type:complete
MITFFAKIPILKRLIPSIGITLLKLLKKNRGYFNINGFKMYLDFLDPIDRLIILNKSYEDEEINILMDLIKKNSISTFIDIGANCGFYSFKLALQNLKIFAFEPNSEAFLKMKNTIKKNKKISNNIKTFPFGLSNKNLIMPMRSLVKHGYTQTGGSCVVENKSSNTNNLKIYNAEFKIGDEILKFKKQDILAIKIDVEGHELNVLMGIQNLIKYNKCILQIEIFDKNFDSINSFLVKNNFLLIDQFKKRFNYFYSNIFARS